MLAGLGLDELRDRLEDVKDNMQALAREIHRVEEAIQEEQRNINSCTYLLADQQFLNSEGFTRYIQDISKRASDILFENFIAALDVAEEYNYPIFIGGFKKAAYDNDTISIKYDAATLKITDVIIDLDKTAGTLEEFNSAVKQVRDEHGWGATRGQKKTTEGYEYEVEFEDLATRIWYNKIYAVDRLGAKVMRRYVKKSRGKKGKESKKEYVEKDVTKRYKGKYTKTIQARQPAFQKPAPWWRLMEYGNSVKEGESPPAPTNPPTGFVKRTKDKILDTWISEYQSFKTQIINDLSTSKRLSERAIDKLESYLKELESNLFEETPEFEVSLDKIMEYLQKLGKYDNADPIKLKGVAQRIVEGEEVGRIRVGGGVRFSTIELARDIRAAIQHLHEENDRKSRDVQ